MKYIYLFILILLCSYTAISQTAGPLDPDRLTADAQFAPFFHGVASGDPLPDAVIIWTRVTSTLPSVDVDWYMALDTGMTQIVAQGTVTTDASKDYTVKVDVTGLNPYTTYYYDFFTDNKYSIRGRTRTAPQGNQDSLRFAVMSCASYEWGYYNAYKRVAERNDIDAVLHLGDYIYEGDDGTIGAVRPLVPLNELVNLSDYRMRHSYHKLDSDLRDVHQQHPFIVTWDDHETANNSWLAGADGHDPNTQGTWFDRKSAGIKAYFEWLPVRMPDPNDDERIYRKLSYGNLVDLFVMDTRLEGREEQEVNVNDPNRTILGANQFNWLINGMKNSNAQWKVMAQQVMMTPFELAGNNFSDDSWDGYVPERNRLFDSIILNNIQDFVVVTGDIHSGWGSDLPMANYDPNTGANSAGVEFVAPSVTTPTLPISAGESIIKFFNEQIKYVDINDHGYFVLDLNQQRAQADWYHVDQVLQPSTSQNYDESWYTATGSRHLTQGSGAATPPTTNVAIPAPPLPRSPISSSVSEPSMVLLGAHPNPFSDYFAVQYYLRTASTIAVSVIDISGRVVLEQPPTTLGNGLQTTVFDGTKLLAGTYFIRILNGKEVQQIKVIKI